MKSKSKTNKAIKEEIKEYNDYQMDFGYGYWQEFYEDAWIDESDYKIINRNKKIETILGENSNPTFLDILPDKLK